MVRGVSRAARVAAHSFQPGLRNPGIHAVRGYALGAFRLICSKPATIRSPSKELPSSKQARHEIKSVKGCAKKAFGWKKV